MVTKIEFLFCSECGGLIIPIRENGEIVFRCKCGHTEVILNKTQKQIKEPLKKSKSLDEIYDFPNKIASRRIIKNYLTELRNKGLIKPFSHQKVMILTHIEGWDIKQIFLPLGYQKKNIYIIEKDKSVFEEINNRDFFNEMHKQKIDLFKYKSRKVFDVIYLDFKGNISRRFLKIILNLILENSHSGTVFYINLQMSREIKQIGDTFRELKSSLIDLCKESIEQEKGKNERLIFLEMMLKSVFEKRLLEQEKLGVNNAEIISFKFRLEGNEFVLDRFNNNAEKLKKIMDYLDLVKNKETEEECVIKKLMETNDAHLLRMKLIQLFIKGILDLYLKDHKHFEGFYDKINFSIPLKHNLFSPLKEITPRDRNLLILMRYLSNSLITQYYRQFIYYNKSKTPFLSIIFLLMDEKQILDHNGIADLRPLFMDGIALLYYKSKGILQQKNLTLTLDSFEGLKFMSEMEHKKKDLSPQEIYEKQLEFRRYADDKLRTRLNKIRNIFNDLKKYEMFKLEDNKFSIRIFNSNLIKNTLTKTLLDDRFFANSKGLDASPTLLSFYLMLRFLRKTERGIEKTTDIKDADIIDINEGINIDDYLDKNYSLNLDSEDFLVYIEMFKLWIKDTIKHIKKRYNSIKKNLNQITDKKEIETGTDLLKECVLVNKSLFAILNKREQEKLKAELKEHKIKEVMIDMVKNELSKKELGEVVRKFIKNFPDLKSSEISKKVNTHISGTYGYNPEISDHQIRAYKYWERVESEE